MFSKEDQIKGYDDVLLAAMNAEDQRQEDHIELIATLHQTDPVHRCSFQSALADRIVEAEYAEDEACDIEYEARNALYDLGVTGWATGRFSETVAQAIDRAAAAGTGIDVATAIVDDHDVAIAAAGVGGRVAA